jgi:hypothetical protein
MYVRYTYSYVCQSHVVYSQANGYPILSLIATIRSEGRRERAFAERERGAPCRDRERA